MFFYCFQVVVSSNSNKVCMTPSPQSREEGTPIVRHSFIQMSKLTNLKGRINYIFSHARQENLYAVYDTTERKFGVSWQNVNKKSSRKVERR